MSRAGVGRGGEDRRHLVVGQARHDRRHHHAHGNARCGQLADRPQPVRGPRGPRLQFSGQIGVERGHGNKDGNATVARELTEDIAVAGDEGVLRDDRDRVAQLGAHLEAGAGQPELAFGRLIAVGHAAERDALRLPARRGQLEAEQFGRAEFHHDFGLEIEPARETEKLVIRPCVAVGAAVLATSIRIQGPGEGQVGAVVGGEDRFRRVEIKLGAGVGRLVKPFGGPGVPGGIRIGCEPQALKVVGWVDRRAAAGKRRTRSRGGRVHLNTLPRNAAAPARFGLLGHVVRRSPALQADHPP